MLRFRAVERWRERTSGQSEPPSRVQPPGTRQLTPSKRAKSVSFECTSNSHDDMMMTVAAPMPEDLRAFAQHEAQLIPVLPRDARGLERSAVFAGGSANVTADERTHAADMLMFSGVAGSAGALRVTFGLRDFDGNRNFLVRFSAEDAVATPEPASMFLIGTGLAGLAALRTRRRRERDDTR